MPYNLHWRERVVTFEYFGDVTSLDILRSNENVYGDSRFDQLRWQLVFFDDVKSVKFVKQDIRRIAYCDKGAYMTNPEIQVLFVGASELVKEMAELYQSFSSERGWPTVYLQDREQAWGLLRELSSEVF